jgi:hypothetical protein
MAKDDKTQFQNPYHGGLGYLQDPSWIKNHSPKRPSEVESSGLQVQRFAKLADYDIEARKVAIQRDPEEDPMISIIDPLQIVYRMHEWNELPNEIIPPDGPYAGRNWDRPLQPQQSDDVDADGKKEKTKDKEKTGRVRPWSKCWHFCNVIDTKMLAGSRFNRSTYFIRNVDYRIGQSHQLLDVRETLVPEGIWSLGDIDASSKFLRQSGGATHTGEPPEDPGAGISQPVPELPEYQTEAEGSIYELEKWPFDRLHLRLNPGMGREGGYITNASPLNVGFHVDEPLKVEPLLFAQLGDAFVITPDDVYTFTQRDTEGRSLLNLWHDVHFHMEEARDGRIYFTRTPPGVEPQGKPYKGEMIGDPAVANSFTQWGQESVNWRPQIKRPEFYYVPVAPLNPTPTGGEPVWYPPGWDFPVPVPTGSKTAYPFPVDGTKAMNWQSIAIAENEIIQETVPIQIAAAIGTRQEPGVITFPAQVVFRYEAFIIKSADEDLINPTFVDLGGIFVHDVTSGYKSTMHRGGSWDERMIAPGDMISVNIWRDYDHPLDTYSGIAYLFEVAAVIGPTTLEGECFNFVCDDETVATPDPLPIPL